MKRIKLVLAICFFCTAVISKGYSQASCSGGARSGSCTAYSGNAADLWVMNCPTGNLQYTLEVYRYDANSSAQAIIWGDGPNVNIYTDPSTAHVLASNTLTGLSTTQDLDVEVEVIVNGSGNSYISVVTW